MYKMLKNSLNFESVDKILRCGIFFQKLLEDEIFLRSNLVYLPPPATCTA